MWMVADWVPRVNCVASQGWGLVRVNEELSCPGCGGTRLVGGFCRVLTLLAGY